MIERIREEMHSRGIDCLVVSEESNLKWILGEGVTGYLVLTQGRKFLITSKFYRYQIEDRDAEFASGEQEFEEMLEEKAEKVTGEVRTDRISEKIEETFQPEETGLLSDLRSKKSEQEIENIREACKITDEVLEEMKEEVFSGLDEFQAVAEINRMHAEHGVEEAFLSNGDQSLVQKNSLKPHRPPEKKRIGPGDLVIIDSGCRVENYCSDVTRTYCQDPNREQLELFEDVEEVQEKLIEMVEPGLEASRIAEKMEKEFSDRGYSVEENVLYPPGHGVGVEVHESPRISTSSDPELEPGMVITIEPGLHVPGIGGVRIEDVVQVTEEGREVLSHSPREL